MRDDEARERAPINKAGNRLSVKAIEKLKQPGRYHDGHGLYFQITDSGAKSWVYRYERDGRERMMGLGPERLYTLKEARQLRDEAEKLLRSGVDPLDAKKERRLAVARSITFKTATERFITDKGAGWGKIHHAQWRQTFAKYVYPVIGDLAVQSVDTDLVMKVLKPIWNVKQTATRLRGRIEAVLGWATTMRLREGDNPALWKGHLENLLPKPAAVHTVVHHAALPYSDVPAFMEQLRAIDGLAARALEVLILTAARTGEVVNAIWSEIDLVKAEWTIPAERMKMSKEHRVPLSDRVVEILSGLPRDPNNPHVFAGRGSRPINARLGFKALRALRPDVTVHGFRSSFRDWAGDRTAFPREVAEAALAHAIGNGTEAAYRRGDAFDKRRALMDSWATFCMNSEQPDNVVPLHAAV